MSEDVDLEMKKAAGRDGRGAFPPSALETYSAMANTQGGLIFLGIEENPRGKFTATGIRDVAKVKKEAWDALHDRQRVSVNLLTNRDVQEVAVAGKVVVCIEVPRARREQRPVYVGENPLTGTFRRRHEGDYRCDPDAVKRMLAEQMEDARDSKLLEGFSLDDLDPESLSAYRAQLRSTRRDHPWNDLEDREFLRNLAGWRQDRQSGRSGLTMAGLLMFGRLPSILEAVPNYVVDYQERPEPKTEHRWIDRVTTDGTWSGNLYDFYRKVIRKLTTDVKVPFQLRNGQREDDTPVHVALREALVNTVIHADYSGRVSVLVVKRPDLFGFRNPGTMRIPIETAVQGGLSDCRNRGLQKMFQLVGLGEQAGSGLPKIYSNWNSQSWRLPVLSEKYDPDQTQLALRMVSLLPEEVMQELDDRFGPKFRSLPEIERLALATASIEGKVTHARLKSMTDAHSHDLTKKLASLVRRKFLESVGTGRGTYYCLPGDSVLAAVKAFDDFLASIRVTPESASAGKSEQKVASSEHKTASSEHSAAGSEHSGALSALMTQLMEMAASVREKGRVDQTVLRGKILDLCRGRYLAVRCLSELLGRSPETVRVHYLRPMVKEGLLVLRYPEKPNHPDQAYSATER
jgi:predicted HTH transcriptional regulator